MNNPILSFLTELVVRLRTKSPLFFKILQWVSIGVTLVTGVPEFLEYLGVKNLPEWATLLQSKSAGIAALVGIFLAGLPVVNPEPVEVVKESGAVVETQKIVKLPFTDQVDVK